MGEFQPEIDNLRIMTTLPPYSLINLTLNSVFLIASYKPIARIDYREKFCTNLCLLMIGDVSKLTLNLVICLFH